MTRSHRSPLPPESTLALLQSEARAMLARLAELSHSGEEASGEWSPNMDVYESGGAIVVVVETPGLQASDLRVVCKDRALVVRGERHEKAGTRRAFVCLERPRGRFVRVLHFEHAVDSSSARARLADGLLTVTLPLVRERRGREIVIEVENEEKGE